MSMYPDESIQDSQGEKRLKIYARLFWVFLVTTVALATTLLFNLNSISWPGQAAKPEPISSSSASPTESTSSSAVMDYCNSVIETMPGDLAIVLSWGWEIECVEAGGDPDLGEGGLISDDYTAGYADGLTRRIAIDAPEVSASVIAHEAAHAIDFDQLVKSDRDVMADKFGATSWDVGSDYLNNPAEMFAEARIRCLGYDYDPDYGLMTCEEVVSLIAGTQKAEQIFSMEKRAS